MDKKDFEHLVETHYDRLYRSAIFMCNNTEMAEDLVQETFLAASEAFDSFEGRSSFYTWLYGILMNKFRGKLRKKKRRKKMTTPTDDEKLLSTPSDIPEASELLEKDEQAQAVRETIKELPLHHRSVITLRYLEEMSYENISATLGCSIGTVKSRIHYALKKVADKLGKRPVFGEKDPILGEKRSVFWKSADF